MRITVLAGGVGGARLTQGLYQLEPRNLTAVVNTGDDFQLHGLKLCPDLDTVLYTLAGWEDAQQGWGLRDESWNCAQQLGKLGGETWFRLGDRDLATHLYRTQRLSQGVRLTQVSAELAQSAGVSARLLPMADAPVPTRVRLTTGWTDFQDYFVRRQHAEAVLECEYVGAQVIGPSPEVVQALQEAQRIVFAPSNPFLSLLPILSLHGMKSLWGELPARRVAVSPMLGNQAVKGPLANLLQSFGFPVSSLGIAQLLRDWIDVLLIDEQDKALVEPIKALGLQVKLGPLLMSGTEGRRRLAELTLHA